MLKLVALLAVVCSVSGTSQVLKDAETEYLKRSIIRRVNEKFAHRLADASKNVENNDIINGNSAAEINIKDDAPSRDTVVVACCPILECTMTAGFAYPTPFQENVIAINDASDCNKECLLKKKSIPSISAIVTNKKKDQCYCVKGSDFKVMPYKDYQTCILKTMSVDEWRKTQG